jgi:4-alpha-glucanotransferase
MSDSPALEQLAELAGLEPEYWDIWGRHHRISADSKRRILEALGYPAGDDAAIAASRQQLLDGDWLKRLPPVAVVGSDRRPTVDVTLPQAETETRTTVTVIEEEGAYHTFTVRFADLAASDSRDVGGARRLRFRLALPFDLPPGYHKLKLDGTQAEEMRLIVAPPACYLPPALARGERLWGVSAQMYTLKHDDDWGIGDFTALQQLVDAAAAMGAGVIGLNPLHALFVHQPERASPYSPSSRLFLNPLAIDVTAVPEYARSQPAKALASQAAERLSALRAAVYVDYAQVAKLKLAALEAVFKQFRQDNRRGGKSVVRGRAFLRFCEEHGARLHRFAVFSALSEHFPDLDWHDWPDDYQRPDTSAVQAFAEANAERVTFYQFLQWIADEQLAAVQARAKDLGLSVGLYRDLAVGCALESADAWSDQYLIILDAKIGCPPDPFNLLGQDWSVPPIHPHRLKDQAYEPFIAIIRANMRHAGALRIDHVMGLLHLFWIPADGKPADGAYLRYGFDDLLAILALESHRNRCMVIGEDLGTVPEGFRERMAAANVLSYRVLYFEKDGDRFKRPHEYPPLALACITTHDLATIKGFWQGADIDLKHRLKLFPSAEAEQGERAARGRDRWQMIEALRAENLFPEDLTVEAAANGPMTPSLAAALHRYLGRSPAGILLVQIDDLTAEAEQINVPGTVDERPNWRRRLSLTIAELSQAPLVRALVPHLADRADFGNGGGTMIERRVVQGTGE